MQSAQGDILENSVPICLMREFISTTEFNIHKKRPFHQQEDISIEWSKGSKDKKAQKRGKGDFTVAAHLIFSPLGKWPKSLRFMRIGTKGVLARSSPSAKKSVS